MGRSYDLLVIGAGPAGMTAAIYGSRAGLTTAMIEAGAPGGKLLKTAEIANWPGIKETPGAQLAYEMFEHSTAFGAAYLYGNVVQVEDHGEWKKVICEDGTSYEAKAVIVATGTRERMMHIPNEEANIGKGISFCAVCDGAFFKGKEVAVIGGGNSALEEAMYLAQMAKKVYLLIRRDVFRADTIIQEELAKYDNIQVLRKVVPSEVIDDGNRVSALVYEDVDTHEKHTLEVAGIFPYIGLDPVTEFVKELGVCDENGYLLTDANKETKVKGLYGAGDVCAKNLRQVVTAVSDGAIAAQHAFHQIKAI